jgi:outer membrane protein OmpA-like peptidoglycan-associated protein
VGGRYSFEDSGIKWGGTISVFEPPTRLELDFGLFEIFEENGGSRLILTLKRPSSGWSPMTLAGFMGWLGRLTRLIEKAPQIDVERFASDIWEAMWPAYERLLRHYVTGGAKALYRLHFAPGDPALGPEAKSHLDVLSVLMHERSDLAVVIDGYGDDPCSTEDSIKLSAERINAAAKYLEESGIESKRLMRGFALGNYHQLVPSDTEAGRAFNRRIELRPTY